MGSTIMAKSLVHVMWLTTLTFKDPEVIGTLEAPGWHNPPGLSPHPLFPIPCLFLNGLLSPTPYAQPHRGAVGRWGRGREGVGKVPCFQFTVPVCWHFLVFQRPVTSREQRCCHPGEEPPAQGSRAASSL